MYWLEATHRTLSHGVWWLVYHAWNPVLLGIGDWSLEVLRGALTPAFALQTLAAVSAAVIVALTLESRRGWVRMPAGREPSYLVIQTDRPVLVVEGQHGRFAGELPGPAKAAFYNMGTERALLTRVDDTSQRLSPLVTPVIQDDQLALMPRDPAHKSIASTSAAGSLSNRLTALLRARSMDHPDVPPDPGQGL